MKTICKPLSTFIIDKFLIVSHIFVVIRNWIWLIPQSRCLEQENPRNHSLVLQRRGEPEETLPLLWDQPNPSELQSIPKNMAYCLSWCSRCMFGRLLGLSRSSPHSYPDTWSFRGLSGACEIPVEVH